MSTLLLALTIAAAPQAGDESEGSATHLGAYAGTVQGLARPVSVAFSPDGKTLWIAESGRGDVSPGIRRISLEGLSATTPLDASDATTIRLGEGILDDPVAVAAENDAEVYAVCRELGLLMRLHVEGPAKTLASGLVLPTDVDLDGLGHVLVSESGSRRVSITDRAGSPLTALDTGPLIEPTAACLASGAWFAVDGARQRIEHFGDPFDGGGHRASFSDWGFFPSLISSAEGVCYADGRLYVADTDNHRVQVYDATRPDDVVHGFLYSFGVHAIRPGDGAGSMHYPSDVDVSKDAQWLAVCEPLDDRVQLFTRAPGEEPVPDPTRAGLGAPAAHFGGAISASGQFLATMSPESHTVEIHDCRLERPIPIAEIYGYGERLGMLRDPVDLWLGDEGRTLVVVDAGNRRLSRATLRVDPEGELEQNPELAIHMDAVELDALDADRPFAPCAVTAIETEGGRRFVVADRATRSVQFLDDELRPVARVELQAEAFPRDVVAAPDGHVIVVLEHGIAAFDGDGGPVERSLDVDFERTFGRAAWIADDVLAVSDPRRDRIERFRFDGSRFEHAGGFGARGLGPKEFNEPRGIARLGDGRWIVMDHGNHRGQIFDAEGNLLGGFGGRLYVAGLTGGTGR